jgi:hypothetical protein
LTELSIDIHFGSCIQGSGRFIQNENRRFSHISPGERQLLPLADGNVLALFVIDFAQHRIVRSRQGRRQNICSAFLRRSLNRIIVVQ